MGKRTFTEDKDLLFNCILNLTTVEECYDFFEDLCTTREIEEMSHRIRAAKMLSENSVYTEVVSQTGLSTATVSRVNRAIKEGNDGYSTVLSRVKEKTEDGQ